MRDIFELLKQRRERHKLHKKIYNDPNQCVRYNFHIYNVERIFIASKIKAVKIMHIHSTSAPDEYLFLTKKRPARFILNLKKSDRREDLSIIIRGKRSC